MTDYVRVKSGYMRGRRVVKPGDVLAADDPIIKDVPDHYFEPLGEAIDEAGRSLEQRIVVPGTAIKDTIVMKAQPPEKPARKSGRPKVERATRAPGERRGDPQDAGETKPKGGRGRPKLPRDEAGNVIRE